ncbi:hypothetical protein SGPA1_31586 [Streptomyces misionensis JCM 4497]
MAATDSVPSSGDRTGRSPTRSKDLGGDHVRPHPLPDPPGDHGRRRHPAALVGPRAARARLRPPVPADTQPVRRARRRLRPGHTPARRARAAAARTLTETRRTRPVRVSTPCALWPVSCEAGTHERRRTPQDRPFPACESRLAPGVRP